MSQLAEYTVGEALWKETYLFCLKLCKSNPQIPTDFFGAFPNGDPHPGLDSYEYWVDLERKRRSIEPTVARAIPEEARRVIEDRIRKDREAVHEN